MAGRVAAALLRRRDQAAHAAALAVMDQLLSVREPGRDPDSELSLTATDQDWLSVG